MTQSCWQRTLETPLKWQGDVAVVGAGLAGLSLAYWLKTLAPELTVTVLDQAELGASASGRNAGFFTAGSVAYLAQLIEQEGVKAAGHYWNFKQHSLRLMQENLLTPLGVEHRLCGSTTLYYDEEKWHHHAQLLDFLGAFAPEKITRDAIISQGLHGPSWGLHFSQEGSLHPGQLLTKMSDYLQHLGVAIHLQQTVSWSEPSDTGVELICSRGSVKARHVFLAVNGHASQFHAGLSQWVTPKRAQMLALDPGALRLKGNFYDPGQRVYFRQDLQSHHAPLLVGGMRLKAEAEENTVTDQTSKTIQTALHTYAQSMLRCELPVLARWSGLMGFTQEEKPHVRTVPFLPHTTWVGGFSGQGMGLAFGTAQYAIKRFLGLSTPFDDILPC